ALHIGLPAHRDHGPFLCHRRALPATGRAGLGPLAGADRLMSFAWAFLLPLLLVPLVVLGVYLWSLRRKRKQAVTYSSVALLRSVIPSRSRWRRHLPVGLLVVGLAVLAIASARPQVTSTVAIGRTPLVMALDVSRSVCATDVDPNRLTVEQKAAREFVDNQPSGTRMGLIIFS